MKALPALLTAAILAPLTALGALAPDTAQLPANWHPTSLGQAVGYMLLFALVGVLAAIAGYKLFDKATPGDLSREIIENKNIAAAIVAAAVILGVCLIVAAAMLG